MAGRVPPARVTPRRRAHTGLAWFVSVCAALVVDAAALLGAMQIVEFRISHSLPVAGPGGSSSSPPPRPGPVATATAPQRDSRVPTECAEIYSPAMVNTLVGAGLVLQRATSPSVLVESGSDDEALRALMVERPLLECDWLDSAGGTRSGVLTVIAEASPSVAAAVDQRATKLGMTRLAENGGHRWVIEGRDARGVTTGESHFLRDGIWFATRWYGYGPYGYTADMVSRVFA